MAIDPTNKQAGFTIFFAMLVGGLSLAIGAAIFDLTIRELDLSGTAAQSQYAIYAADSGAECALYWDFKCPSGVCPAIMLGSAFATSTATAVPTGSVLCAGVNITAALATPTSETATAATTTFTLTFTGQPYCATVVVAKRGNPTLTTVTSNGYNTCATNAPGKLQRVLQVTY